MAFVRPATTLPRPHGLTLVRISPSKLPVVANAPARLALPAVHRASPGVLQQRASRSTPPATPSVETNATRRFSDDSYRDHHAQGRPSRLTPVGFVAARVIRMYRANAGDVAPALLVGLDLRA